MQHWLNPRNLTEATEVQREMAALVRTEDDLPDIRLIGGADVELQLPRSHQNDLRRCRLAAQSA